MSLLDIIFPEKQFCAFCQTLIPGSRRELGLCDDCLDAILKQRALAEPCPRCGHFGNFFADEKKTCRGLCRYGTAPLRGIIAATPYDGRFREWVQNLKYSGERSLAKPMALIMAQVWRQRVDSLPKEWDVPLKRTPWLAPVPISPLKMRERGFNQSLLLATALSARLGYPVKELLIRNDRGENQAGLNQSHRQRNVRGAFEARSDLGAGAFPEDRLVLLIDDIVTTGETLKACAGALTEAGAVYIAALTWTGGAEPKRASS